jgi:hypothetical protein
MAKFLQSLTVTIPNAGTTSDSATMPATMYCLGLVTPAALTGTAVTFEGSIDGSTFRPLYDEATQYSVNVGTSRYVALKRQVMEPCKYLKVVSGSSEGALRTITLVIGE